MLTLIQIIGDHASQDAQRLHAALGYNASRNFVTAHEGMFLASFRGVTIVHDGVLCNTTHALTAMAAKHVWHPAAHEMHGCQLADGDSSVRLTGSALLLVRFLGWFWGHFCLDSLYKLAFAEEYFESQGLEINFSVIMEERSHASVLALVHAVLKADANSRVLFMPSVCLRGNARKCPFYFRPRELLLVEMFPNVVNLGRTMDDLQDTVPPGIRLAQRKIQAFFNAQLVHLEKRRASLADNQLSGATGVRYEEAGECSDAKTQHLTFGEGHGRSIASCRPVDTWLTSYLPNPIPRGSGEVKPFLIAYIGRGVSPCRPRFRCVSNSGPLVDMLDAVAHLQAIAMDADGGTSDSPQAFVRQGQGGGGCLHVNHELRTHTFLETVALMRRVSMLVSTQGSQLFDALFAPSGTWLVEMVPAGDPGVGPAIYPNTNITAESNRIFYGSLGMRTAILPLFGVTKFQGAPFSVEVCRLVRLIHELLDLKNLVCLSIAGC